MCHTDWLLANQITGKPVHTFEIIYLSTGYPVHTDKY